LPTIFQYTENDGMRALEGYKVVSAKEMTHIEKVSVEEGASEEAYMLCAGKNLATHTATFIKNHRLKKCVTLLVGKGNNGGDAFVAGRYLLQWGYDVQAYSITSAHESTPLSMKCEKAFTGAGGQVHRSKDRVFRSVILDGLLGTGFRGELKGEIVELIHQANCCGLPILSIDIPSGVNGNSGGINPVAIKAKETIFLELPKLGCFLKKGFGFVGKLCGVNFGLDVRFVQQAAPSAYLINEEVMPYLLPPLEPTRHKYEAGYVVALAGSPGMPGAALLSCLAALRAGAGIVRLFYPEGMGGELMAAPYELIRTPYTGENFSQIVEESKRARAVLIGPGLGRKGPALCCIQQIIKELVTPCVIDADGLFLLKTFPEGAILTPHRREMCILLGVDTHALSQELCQQFVDKNGVTLVLKGAPTWIYHPNTSPLIVCAGDPGMATAGTGDVLAGMIAALVAQNVKGRKAAALGVYLHALAGEIAAQQKTSYGVIASDLIETLPKVFQTLLYKTGSQTELNAKHPRL